MKETNLNICCASRISRAEVKYIGSCNLGLQLGLEFISLSDAIVKHNTTSHDHNPDSPSWYCNSRHATCLEVVKWEAE